MTPAKASKRTLTGIPGNKYLKKGLYMNQTAESGSSGRFKGAVLGRKPTTPVRKPIKRILGRKGRKIEPGAKSGRFEPYPIWVCMDCALESGGRVPQVATWHEDICGVCGQYKTCTEPRDFGFPRFKSTVRR